MSGGDSICLSLSSSIPSFLIKTRVRGRKSLPLLQRWLLSSSETRTNERQMLLPMMSTQWRFVEKACLLSCLWLVELEHLHASPQPAAEQELHTAGRAHRRLRYSLSCLPSSAPWATGPASPRGRVFP